MQEIKMNGESLNIEQENIEKLKEIFPEVFNEDKIDFEKLQNVLGNYIDTDEEKYRFTWNGKMDALRLSQTPSTGTLRPCKEESRDWDTTQNLYIEGENLEVLKLLQNSYLNKIKMIYIDPPYNTGGDFVYKDDFKDNITNYKKMTGQIDSDGNSTSTNKETDGRYHTNWLNMMYPRLRLARNLLTDDGVIFISIDNKEIANLKTICDEIFGYDNFIGILTWVKKTKPINSGNAKFQMQSKLDYVLVYCKSKNSENTYIFKLEKQGERQYNHIGKHGLCRLKDILDSDYGSKKRDTMKFPILGIIPPAGQRWKIGEEEVNKLLKEDKLVIIDGKIKQEVYPDDEPSEILNPFWSYFPQTIGTSESGKSNLNELMNGNVGFDTVKPTGLIKEILKHFEDDILILDFFAGTSTTADAIMQMNKISGNRKYILVQFPEILSKDIKSQKDTFEFLKSINKPPILAELGKERIWRAGDKIKKEIEQENQQLKLGEEPKKLPDIGFKVFKLDSSNIRKWNPDTKDLERTLLDQVDNFVEGRKEEDALYEIILKNGLPLTVPVEELNVKGKKVYSIGMGAMIVCLDNNITLDIADEIAKISTEFEDKSMVTVVFKDNGFENDSVKTNIKETLRGYGIGKFVTV